MRRDPPGSPVDVEHPERFTALVETAPKIVRSKSRRWIASFLVRTLEDGETCRLSLRGNEGRRLAKLVRVGEVVTVTGEMHITRNLRAVRVEPAPKRYAAKRVPAR